MNVKLSCQSSSPIRTTERSIGARNLGFVPDKRSPLTEKLSAALWRTTGRRHKQVVQDPASEVDDVWVTIHVWVRILDSLLTLFA